MRCRCGGPLSEGAEGTESAGSARVVEREAEGAQRNHDQIKALRDELRERS